METLKRTIDALVSVLILSLVFTFPALGQRQLILIGLAAFLITFSLLSKGSRVQRISRQQLALSGGICLIISLWKVMELVPKKAVPDFASALISGLVFLIFVLSIAESIMSREIMKRPVSGFDLGMLVTAGILLFIGSCSYLRYRQGRLNEYVGISQLWPYLAMTMAYFVTRTHYRQPLRLSVFLQFLLGGFIAVGTARILFSIAPFWK